jgi:hypothetical protein
MMLVRAVAVLALTSSAAVGVSLTLTDTMPVTIVLRRSRTPR